MAKTPPPLDEKHLRLSTARIEKAWEALRKHVLMGPLVMRAKLKIINYQPQVPAMFTTVASSGEIFANPFNYPRSLEEWTFVLAHSLLHLAFGHSRHIKRGIVWNIACDCVVNEFLARMRIGTAPEGFLHLPPGMPNDEEKLFTIWSQNGSSPKGDTTNGSAVDMSASGSAKANWADIFARAVRRAAKESLNLAAGEHAELGQAAQARAWFVKNYPLLGAVLQHFKLIEDARLCERLQIRVAAVSPARRELLLNPGWAMSDGEYRYVLAHMALHAGFQHLQRREGRDPFVWNAACDYCVNSWLARMPLLKTNCNAPGEGQLLSAEFQDLSPEEIYERLNRNPKAAHKLITLAGESTPDVLGIAEEKEDGTSGRLLLDALLRGYQIHTESGKGALPYTLIDELRALEHPPLAWDVQLAQWFDKHIPPVERVRTYGRASRRQSATPNIARPKYVWPDTEHMQRATFGLIVDSSGALAPEILAEAIGAIGVYALSRNIQQVRIVTSGAGLCDLGMVAADIISHEIASSPRSTPKLQPAIELLDSARDFPTEAPVLILAGMPCDRIGTRREHAFLVRKGNRLPFQTDAAVIGIG